MGYVIDYFEISSFVPIEPCPGTETSISRFSTFFKILVQLLLIVIGMAIMFEVTKHLKMLALFRVKLLRNCLFHAKPLF